MPASMFKKHPVYQLNFANGQHGTQAQNLRFADGTSACFAPGDSGTVSGPKYAENNLVARRIVSDGIVPTLMTVAAVGTRAAICPARTYTLLRLTRPCSVADGHRYGAYAQHARCLGRLGHRAGLGGGRRADQSARRGLHRSIRPSAYQLAEPEDKLPGAATRRTPNALVASSPVIFGSLPTGIQSRAAGTFVHAVAARCCSVPYPSREQLRLRLTRCTRVRSESARTTSSCWTIFGCRSIEPYPHQHPHGHPREKST